jgi:two-component system, NtrC family, C4-dicarboxylate transport response regulator DctD
MANILLVEDEYELRIAWAEALGLAGNTVRTAEDGVQAIKQMSTGAYDVLIFDLNLPRMSGLEAIKLIRRTEPDLPILAVTGVSDPGMARAVIEAGANNILFKPIMTDELIEVVASYARQQPPR